MKLLVQIASMLLCSQRFSTVPARAVNERTGMSRPNLLSSFQTEYRIKVVPDPTESSIAVTFTLNNRTAVQLILFNIIGQPIARWGSGMLNAGIHRIELKSLRLGYGLYLLSFQTSAGRILVKILYLPSQRRE